MNLIATPATLAVAMHHLKIHDPVMAQLVDAHGVPHVQPHKDYYRSLVESIISQQLSVKAADTILQRFIALFPNSSFPTPAELVIADTQTLRTAGLSRQKISYIQDLASRVLDGSIIFDHFDDSPNDVIIQELTAVKGIGVWTAHMFLMFCMGRLDILPVGDLGIKNAIHALYPDVEKPTAERITAVAKAHHWHPYETVASWYLWQSLDAKPPVAL